ncbi:MAG: ABC transporter permease subunit [Devosia sp.]
MSEARHTAPFHTSLGGGEGARARSRLAAVRPRPRWRRPATLRAAFQITLLALFAAVAVSVVMNVSENLPRANLSFGFDFLTLPTRFEIGPNALNATARDPVWMTFAVGLINTIRVSLFAIVLCTVLGLVVALARLSRNLLVSRVALIYVETVRNIPLLLQMLFWYGLSTLLPLPRDAWNPVAGVFFTNRGVYHPAIDLTGTQTLALAVFGAGLVGAFILWRIGVANRERTGRDLRLGRYGLVLAFAMPVAILLASGDALTLSTPALTGFNFRGGSFVTPEFVAVLISLSVYQSGFAAETFRSGILGVKPGQVEAARSLGLPPSLVFGKVVLPQAMRIVVPPMAGQYMSLIKNSSLAVVIGYPELVRVSTAVISETGRAIECILLLMAMYLMLSLLTSAFMNWYNRRITLADA